MQAFTKTTLPQWLVRARGRCIRVIRTLFLTYVTPIAAWRSMRGQFARQYEVFESDILAAASSNYEMHRPSKRDVQRFVWSEYYWPIMRFILFWLVIQVVIGSYPSIAKVAQYHWTLHKCYSIALLWFILIDLIILGALLGLICASVSLYGPTNVAYVLSFRYNPKTAVLYRLAYQSLPRGKDDTGTHALQWEFTRVYVKKLARQEARRRLIQAVAGFVCIVICLSCISMFLSAEGLYHPLLKIGNVEVRADGGILPHIYFFMISFATIGYGDVAFTSGSFGLVTGIITSALVMFTGLGLVSYLNYYVLNFKDRLIAGLDGAVGSGTTPEWIWQSLRDV